MDRKKLSEIGRTIPAAHPDSSTQWEAHIVMSPEERRELVNLIIRRFMDSPNEFSHDGIKAFIESEGL